MLNCVTSAKPQPALECSGNRRNQSGFLAVETHYSLRNILFFEFLCGRLKTRNTKEVSNHLEVSMSDQEIKQRIHQKALDHFLQFGFSKVTMNEIADELGMSKKTLYQYFPGKEDLLAAVVGRLHEDTASEIEVLVNDGTIDFLQKLHGALDILAAFHGKMTPYFLADMEKHAPDVCRLTNDFKRDRVRNIMSKLVAEGIQKGVFRNDIDQELIVLIYAGALQHLLRPDTVNRLGLSVSQIHQIIGSVIIEGIVRPQARNQVFTESRFVQFKRKEKISPSQSITTNRGLTAVRRNLDPLER